MVNDIVDSPVEKLTNQEIKEAILGKSQVHRGLHKTVEVEDDCKT